MQAPTSEILDPDGWFKSTYSGQEADCVEVNLSASAAGFVGIGDTKNRSAGHLVSSAASWSALLTAVNSGNLDKS